MPDFREQVRALRQRIAALFDYWAWFIELSVAGRRSGLGAGSFKRHIGSIVPELSSTYSVEHILDVAM